MSSEAMVRLCNVGKSYHLYDTPRDRLKQLLMRGRRNYFREFWALRDVSLSVGRGETIGVVGRNGAGKSTLLQIVCGILSQTTGDLYVNGRVAGLLELGAGFNPEFSGRENVYLNAAILGLSNDEIDDRYDEIVAFSEIGEAIHQPVKTYSSGMFLRLAFSVATSVDPDILIVDEALSVGDGAFSRKSFDRIMGMKNSGTTVFFCSHSLYQVEAICDRAVWLDQGCLQLIGTPAEVTAEYGMALSHKELTPPAQNTSDIWTSKGGGHIVDVRTSVDGQTGKMLHAKSMESSLLISVDFQCDPLLPPPSVLVGISLNDGLGVTSAGTVLDGQILDRDGDGFGSVELEYQSISLLKGIYVINVFLACERGIHSYDSALSVAKVKISHEGPDQGLVALPHSWRQ